MERSNKLDDFNKLREEYPLFIYENASYSLSGNSLSFNFTFKLGEKVIFTPASTIILPFDLILDKDKLALVENIVFHIGMIELVSYWKATCSPTIQVKAGTLNIDQVNWWKDVYFNGLGEFFYLNSIVPDKSHFVDIISEGKTFTRVENVSFKDEYIVPIGGGKDSAVTLELLSNSGRIVHPLIMNPRGATIHTVNAAGLSMDNTIVIKRAIDSNLLKLNDAGFLNGHTPFSAMLAFYTLLVSTLTGFRNIALSNESSANEATIPGSSVNHQYSKSIEFESNFRDYYREYINDEINYFSFLRPLDELQIAHVFSKLNKYHQVFRSCNVGSKDDTWCGHCPKCLFTYIMLAAHTSLDYVTGIIGQPMLDSEENTRYFDELCGFSSIKPFECVGTIDDVNIAMQMIVDKYPENKLPLLAKRFIQLHKGSENKIIDAPSGDHFLKKEEFEIIKLALQ